REPSASPESKSGRMLGWLSPAARRISRRKRSGPNDWPRSARRTLSATWRSWRISCARYTVAIPPVPSSRTRRYRPVRAAPSRSADELGASRDIFRRLVGPKSRRGGASHGGLRDQEDTSSGRSRHSERLARLRHGVPWPGLAGGAIAETRHRVPDGTQLARHTLEERARQRLTHSQSDNRCLTATPSAAASGRMDRLVSHDFQTPAAPVVASCVSRPSAPCSTPRAIKPRKFHSGARRMNGPVCFVWRLLSMCLVTAIAATPTLHAQTQTPPAADMSVAVRMVDAVNSAKDPAGKQYRASVAKAVDFGNGVTIPQDALAYVRLVDSGNGSGFTTQLVSVMLKGKPVAIASSSVSATSASNAIAVKAMNSALAGLGHHVNAPTGTAPVATGQQVTLPRGTTVTFVLAQRPAP